MFKAMKQKLFGTGQPTRPGSAPSSGNATPNDAAALLAQGDALLEQGKPGQASKCYQQATALNPRDAGAFIKLGRALTEQGRHEEAQASLEQAVALDPESADACYLLGTNCKERGDTNAAIAHCAKALELKPDFTPCRLFLCLLLLEVGRPDDAKALILAGIELTPDVADFHFYLGNLLTEAPTLAAAVASFRTALSLRADYPEALGGLANALHWMGQFDAAVENYEKAIALKSDYPGVYCSLAETLIAQGKLDAAVDCYRKALTIDPEFARAHCDLGSVLKIQGKLDESIEHYRRAVSINPNSIHALNCLGQSLFLKDRRTEAMVFLQRALKIDENHVDSNNTLGVILTGLNRNTEAIACIRKALQFSPDLAVAHSNLGNLLQEQSNHDAALESYKKALSLNPALTVAQSGLLFTVNYHPSLSAEQVFSVYREYEQRWGLPLRRPQNSHENSRDTARRLRIGYVSPDFCEHTVGYFLLPAMSHHDKQSVEVFAYAEIMRDDAGTTRYRACVDHWIPTRGMTDDAMADRIRADHIDILVDLAGHTANNRLGVFARKPAPVSVSWLGFGYTTGLSAIDYYLTDEVSAPPGSEPLFAEHPWRIRTPAYVYRPPVQTMGPVGSLPALARGHITFGTLTRAVRINHRTIRVWAQILQRLPDARLRVDSKSYLDADMRSSLTAKFAEHGITSDRLDLGFNSPPWDVLRAMDIGLDCFPHNSGTTLFETLYMGLPYVTLADRPSVGRLGSSILHGIGHPEWIAKTEDEYVEIAVALASDLDALAALRSGLRSEMEASPLRDEVGFARKVENAYKEMFARWASSTPAQ